MSQHSGKTFVCPWWIGYLLISPVRRLLQNPDVIVAPYVKEGMTVVEIGPGMGFFTLSLARRVGAKGKVICVDVQERMLATLKKRATKAGLAERIATIVATEDSLHLNGLEGGADLAFAFAVVHEVPDQAGLFVQLFRALKPGGVLLLSEPTGHVTAGDFERTLGLARAAGFVPGSAPDIARSITRVLRKK